MAATDDIIESVGTKLSISVGKPTTFDGAGYAAKTYTEVGFLIDLGEHGPESGEVKVNLLSANISRKRKGIRDFGSLPVGLALVPADDGQIMMRAAEAGRDPVSVCLELPDTTKEYFMAFVMSFKVNPGNSESTVMASSNLGIDSESVWVDPA